MGVQEGEVTRGSGRTVRVLAVFDVDISEGESRVLIHSLKVHLVAEGQLACRRAALVLHYFVGP